MSRAPKWKLEKNKVKVVFRLQFHATHIPQPGWDKLFISFIPLETGKATAKTTKSNVRNGNCKWSDPIYETTRLLNDTRTKKYDDKIYKLVVSMGTTRSNILGEVNINLADFADALKPSSISLPLEGCDFGTVLHVTVQLLTSKTGFREFEQQREVGEKGIHMIPEQAIHEPMEKVKASADKANSRIRFRQGAVDLTLLEDMRESTRDYEGSAAAIDGSSCTSESMYTEKSDIISTTEIVNTNAKSGSIDGFSHGQISQPSKLRQDDHQLLLPEESIDLAHGWSSDYSLDNDLTIASEVHNSLQGTLQVVASSISDFKVEMSSLQSLADELSAETNSMAQKLAGELDSGEVLAKEVSLLKSECLKFKGDLEKLKHAKEMLPITGGGAHSTNVFGSKTTLANTKSINFNDAAGAHFCAKILTKSDVEVASFDGEHEVLTSAENPDSYLCNSQIKWPKALSLLENKLVDIHNKVQILCHGTDADIFYSDFETLKNILQSLKQGVTFPLERSELVEGVDIKDAQATHIHNYESFIPGHSLVETSNNSMKDKVCGLLHELDLSRIQEENLTKKMNQMEHYYEALIHELEESHKDTLSELRVLKSEHSSCLYNISSLQTQLEEVQRDMNDQLSTFSKEKYNMHFINMELEKRAHATESMLKKMRWNYSISVERLQNDLELLSHQVLSMFETNENIAKQAFAEASQLLSSELPQEHSKAMQSCLDNNAFLDEKSVQLFSAKQIEESQILNNASLQLANNLGQNSDNLKLSICEANVNHDPVPNIQFVNDELMNEKTCSIDLMWDVHLKTEAELLEMHQEYTRLEMFSKILEETLHEKLKGIKIAEEELNEFSRQLVSSKESKEALKMKLQNMMNDAKTLREKETKRAVEFEDLALRTQILDAKLEDVLEENSHLSEQVAKFQRMLLELKGIKNKYISCDAEKRDLEYLLKQESLQKITAQKELDFIIEECKALKGKSMEQHSVIDGLEEIINLTKKKLYDLGSRIISFENGASGPHFSITSLELELQNNNEIAVMLHLEQYLQASHERILQLQQEKKEAEEQRNIAQMSLNSTQHALQELMDKLNSLNALVEEYKYKLKLVSEKLNTTSEAESVHAEKNRELSTRLSTLNFELQRITSENINLAEKLIDFENVKKELESTKLKMIGLEQQKETMTLSLQSERKALFWLENEFCSLKEKLKCRDDEIETEKVLQKRLEHTIEELQIQLRDKCNQLTSSDVLKTKISDLNALISKLESENSGMQKLLMQQKEYQDKLINENTSLVSNLERTVSFASEKLSDICYQLNCENEICLGGTSFGLEIDNNYSAVLMHLKKLLHGAHEKILQLEKEKKDSVQQRTALQSSLGTAESGLQDFVIKLDISNSLMEKQRLELQDVSEKLKITSEAGEFQAEKNKELLSRFAALENELQIVTRENRDLTKMLHDFGDVKGELEKATSNLISCTQEKDIIMLSLQSAKDAFVQQENDLCTMKERLQYANNELQSEKVRKEQLQDTISRLASQLNEKCEMLLSYGGQEAEMARLKLRTSELESGKSELQHFLFQQEELSKKLRGEISLLQTLVSDRETESERIKLNLLSCMQEKEMAMLSLQSTKETSDQLENELYSMKERLRCANNEIQSENVLREKLQDTISRLTSQLNEKCEVLLSYSGQEAKMAKLKSKVSELELQRSGLKQDLLLKQEEFLKTLNAEASFLQIQVSDRETELIDLKETLKFTQDQLQSEKLHRYELEARVTDLNLQLNEKHEQLMSVDVQKMTFVHLRQQVSDLESDKSELESLYSQSLQDTRTLQAETSFLQSKVISLKNELDSVHESLRHTSDKLASERDLREKLDVTVTDLGSQLEEKDQCLQSYIEQKKKHEDLQHQIAELKLEKSEIEHLLLQGNHSQSKLKAEKSLFQIQISDLEIQFLEMHEHLLTADIQVVFVCTQFQTRIQVLANHWLALKTSYYDAHFKNIDAQQNILMMKEKYTDENERLIASLRILKSEYEILESEKKGLEYKISNCMEMILSYEELIDYLRFSRDELDITITVLRSKLDEQQAPMSMLNKYYSELLNLQKQHDELSYRLSEQILKTEEFKNLSIHLKELKDKAEAECMQLREKRETEAPSLAVQESLRMAFIKEQCETKVQELRSQLNASKKHGEELLLKLQSTLDEVEMRKKCEVAHLKRNEELSMKVLELEAELQTVIASRRELVKSHDRMKAELECAIISLECCKEEKLKLETYMRESNEEKTKNRVELDLMKRRLEILASTADAVEQRTNEPGTPSNTSFGQLLEGNSCGYSPVVQQIATKRSMSVERISSDGLEAAKEADGKITSQRSVENGELQEYSDFDKQIKVKEELQAKIAFIHSELERLKDENSSSVPPVNVHQVDPDLQGLQKELSQLHMANEHLGHLYPLFKDFPGCSNALERILALELEVAEAMQTNKTDAHIRSSPLKQYSDEKAVFQSFRDINELIKDMLDLKGRYATVETELKEMHSRYSQLSLQFAEVEGERQKLMMTLKNRTPKKH